VSGATEAEYARNVSDGPTLSVVLPNYNHGHLIHRALVALAEQDRPPDEIIVIDDGSTDDSLAVLREFAEKARIMKILVNSRNMGAVPTIARGLEVASGRYVYFAAADDFIMPGFFRLALDLLERRPEAGLFCGEAHLVDGVTNRWMGMRPAVRPASRTEFIDPRRTQALLAHIDNWILTGCALFRRDAVVAMGGFDEQLGSFADGYVARKVALTHGFCYAPKVVATWCIYPDSVSRTTALQVDKARRVLDTLPNRIAADPVFPAWYAKVFAKRWRFAAARLALEANPIDHELLLVMGAPSSIDRAFIRLVWGPTRGQIARILTLAWLWLRLRPTSLLGLMRTALARRIERATSSKKSPQPASVGWSRDEWAR
jgi:glycosyltransferase involved in cell wall biosynthesis